MVRNKLKLQTDQPFLQLHHVNPERFPYRIAKIGETCGSIENRLVKGYLLAGFSGIFLKT